MVWSFIMKQIVNPDNEKMTVLAPNGDRFFSPQVSSKFSSFLVLYWAVSVVLTVLPNFTIHIPANLRGAR